MKSSIGKNLDDSLFSYILDDDVTIIRAKHVHSYGKSTQKSFLFKSMLPNVRNLDLLLADSIYGPSIVQVAEVMPKDHIPEGPVTRWVFANVSWAFDDLKKLKEAEANLIECMQYPISGPNSVRKNLRKYIVDIFGSRILSKYQHILNKN